MATTTIGLNKSNLLSKFMGSIEDNKYLRDIVISFLSMNWLRTRTILSSIRVDEANDPSG
ncbi:hypothetical protein AHAS_Ahas09G0188700 [Arachis hypogaea]